MRVCGIYEDEIGHISISTYPTDLRSPPIPPTKDHTLATKELSPMSETFLFFFQETKNILYKSRQWKDI